MAHQVQTSPWQHAEDRNRDEQQARAVCDLCPRGCKLVEGARGFCFVRQNQKGQIVSTTYGRSTGFCIDPIEKKPLNQFYPGSAVLSFGTAGCNLGCKYCQNWTSTKSSQVDAYCEKADPRAIAEAAQRLRCRSVAFTYNDPIVWAEYAIDTAKACRAVDVKTVAVTSGYIGPVARADFFEYMDAANVDLKGFSESFYRKYCNGQLQPVLDTLSWLVHETDVWLELTNLLIPGCNDSPDELKRMCGWIADELGTNVPIHFTAFHPAFQMPDTPATPLEMLLTAHETAKQAGLNFVYTGNVHDPRRQCTFCPGCGKMVIERDGYHLGQYELENNRCRHCGREVAGRYDQGMGDWRGGRQPVRIADYAEAEIQQEKTQGVSTMSGQTESGPDEQGRPELNEQEEKAVFRAAGCQLAATVLPGAAIAVEPLADDLAEHTLLGAFVSLKRKGVLRSCCGFMGQTMPLGTAVEQAAIRTAADDPRFPPISPVELPYLDLEVWLLWGLQPVSAKGADRIEAVEIGRHGLQIARGQARGLLLPGVAVDNDYDAEAFLGQVCLKAGLPPDAWRDDDTALMTFEGRAVNGQLRDAVELPSELKVAGGPTQAEVAGLAEFCHQNVVALLQGATPNCYMPGGYDGNVQGLRLTVDITPPGSETPVVEQCGSLVFKPGMPLQSSLFNLAQAMSETLRRHNVALDAVNAAKVGLSVLFDPSMHGLTTDSDADDTDTIDLDTIDLEGVDPHRRAVVVLQQAGWAWAYDSRQSIEEVLAKALTEAHLSKGAPANVLSMEIVSTDERASIGNVPEPQSPRAPAVAGQFYPGTPAQMGEAVDSLIADAGEHDREAWAGAMLPHAGWVYSGRLAADVLSRIEIPENVIIFAPKHRPGGARWAVSPCTSWLLPGARVEGDAELAKKLADGVEGFELDATAHRQEHSVEVQLPLIARMSPQTKVTAVVMQSADWAELQACAEQLAAVIKDLPASPLLLISSDMNHFAADDETRRLDRLALAQIEARDPQALLETVRENNISMCGVVPAVLVMETLRHLGRLERTEQIGHTTSAEASGDKTKVVGYAGVLFG